MRTYLLLFFFFSLFSWSNNNTPRTNTAASNSKEIIIRGNHVIDTSAYLDALGVTHKEWFEFWKDDKATIPRKAISDIHNRLQDFLESEGYYNPKINIHSSDKKIIVTIKENRPVHIRSIDIKSDFNITHIVTFKKNGRFGAAKFIQIKKDIKQALMRAGYCNYKLDTKAYVDLLKHAADLTYQLHKGKLCRFGDTVILSKPKNISEQVIRSRIQYKKGEVYSTEKINRTFDALNSLDAFGGGIVAPKESFGDESAIPSQTVPMEISLAPKEKLNIFKGGVGYDTALGMRLQLYYERRNFMGNARKLTAKMQYSRKSQMTEITMLTPALFTMGNQYFDFYSESGFIHNIYTAYNENKAYWTAKLSCQKGNISTDLGIGMQRINIKKTQTDPSIIDGNFLLAYPFVNFIYDGRDSKINPRNGYYFSAYTEYGLDYRQNASTYLKYLLEARAIKTFDKLTLAAVGKFGIINEFSGSLPASKLFYAGGAYSNRAYGEHEIGSVTSPVSSSLLGGKTWLNLSAEADYPINGDLYGAVFFDSTTINKKAYDFHSNTINSAGFGLRYMTPVGPIKVDIGANIRDIHQYGISFQIGQSF